MNKTSSKKYDLEERTAKFAEKIIELAKKAPKNVVTIPIINQLVKSGTSIGANYCEANGASSKRDFTNKIFICKKESKETKYWLRMLAKAVEELKGECQDLWREAQEYTLIFSKIAANLKAGNKI
ncbi:four helix bundle protein [Candidatus Curtissbacteria bacterium RIFCSPHIGHO2_02_FULL_42_15]|uniref:Four helix bundle protein n=1 Tax=Candidatus Curtissbacteria bacterium RIFCSPHIGHO2_02_FULL_42_15 TaxID=1797716 RepID=A0A1F5GJJ7_9BACT|nr:MAG: four helix bundle protein [Candidatus Curtissbacteria bacterium RIFCSPHIGHO2_02_FULL_42_15]